MLGRPQTLIALALALAACHSKGDSADPGGTPGAAVWAANAADVTRFADEVPFGPEALVARDKTVVRKSPGGGEVVATLPMGADVVKLAAHADEVLVCFDDPKPGGAHLMGWVTQSALQDATPPPAPVPTVPEPPPPPLPATQDDGGAPQPPSPTPHGHHHKGGKRHGRQPQQQ